MNAEYVFKVGDIVKTRDGRQARILAVDVAGPQPIAAAVVRDNGSGEWVSSFYANGGFLMNGEKCNDDLMPPKKVWYMNVYLLSSGYATRKDADEAACRNRTACVRVEEGQFDE